MNKQPKLRYFSYKFDKGSGPLPKKLLKGKIISGNCRLAVQDYFFSIHNYYLKPKDILLPLAYQKVGTFVKLFEKGGDIIYAENVRNKKEEVIYKDRKKYKNEDAWILFFHSAIYLGKMSKKILNILPFESNINFGTPVIWHCSFISGSTDIWPLKKFLYYYKPVAAKRILKDVYTPGVSKNININVLGTAF